MHVSDLVVGSGETLDIGAGSLLVAGGVRIADGGVIRIGDNGVLSLGSTVSRIPAVIRITQALALVEIAPIRQAERVQVVSLAPGDVLEALTLMLQNGDVAPGDVAACLYGFSTEQRQAGLYPPDWPVIAAVVALYKEHGANLHTQQNFVRWLIDSAKGRALGLGSISLSTFQRYLATWEQNTGQRVRPGKGRRKRGAQL